MWVGIIMVFVLVILVHLCTKNICQNNKHCLCLRYEYRYCNAMPQQCICNSLSFTCTSSLHKAWFSHFMSCMYVILLTAIVHPVWVFTEVVPVLLTMLWAWMCYLNFRPCTYEYLMRSEPWSSSLVAWYLTKHQGARLQLYKCIWHRRRYFSSQLCL